MTEKEHWAITSREKPDDIRAVFRDRSEAERANLRVYNGRNRVEKV